MSLRKQGVVYRKQIPFFSANLTPQNKKDVDFLDSSIDDRVYYMAEQVKRKLMTNSKKTNRIPNKNHSCIVKRQINNNQILNAETDNSYNPSLKINLKPNSKQNLRLKNDLQKDKYLSNTLNEQRRLLSKVTIHRIRSQRQNIQNQTKRIQNSYKYLLQKIQKNKKRSVETREKQLRHEQIRIESLRTKEFIQKEKLFLNQQDSIQKSRLRQTVICQKDNKQRSMQNFYSKRVLKAQQIREASEEFSEQIFKTQMQELSTKKSKYVMQKQKQRIRLLNRQKIIENKKLHAQMLFKQRWLNQFSKNTRARQVYVTKKDLLSKKMQNLLQELRKQEQTQKEQTSHIRFKGCLSSEGNYLNI